MTQLNRRERGILCAVLLFGAYEAASPWLACLRIAPTVDVFYACSVTLFGLHHIATILLLLAAAWVLLAGLTRQERS